ncbi:GMP synthase [glutamine-hydrolyzing] [Capsulimonas corticalis]|uniref:GMP synthase [glutamine-hydrolyzing] n=1 Tax=Capsulimonas corticalis TaxID=2219043 RepID=A0A402CPE5_9BACT|nr:glutamine-hydrolyzing GMP synthase [Capsulimonas corticalis]BDI33024.1 GMP synthase [glutamine-hydrolyzing] [Capsulimonas corticalis]
MSIDQSSGAAIAPVTPSELIIVLDFGAQYTQLIARRIRECHTYCEILPYDVPIETIKARNPVGLVFSGGPSSVYEAGAPRIDKAIYDLGLPILGICYGMQSMANDLGGVVSMATLKEFGKTRLDVLDPTVMFEGLNRDLICWMSHGDTVEAPPPGFTIAAATDNCPVAAMYDAERRFYAVQFHPEVVHTPWGTEIIRNFLEKVVETHGLWTMESFIEQQVQLVRDQVGENQVVCGLSGGIDSCTVAALVHKAIGSQLTCIFVNHGLLRKGEEDDVRRKFAAAFNINLIYVDAVERFVGKLAGVTDPERKRKIIGEEFVRVFEEESLKLTNAKFLAQGTLYPDVIESGTKSAAKIKTHHNVGGLPENMNLKLVEPLRYLFKDEVRAVAEELGLPSDMVWRQPFPGPGLAIRITGEVTMERLHLLRSADWVIIDEIKRAGLYRKVWQSFAVLIPTKSVGVMGDQRTYAYPIVLRAVTSEDAMTAEWARLPYEVLERISSRIVNEVPGVNRVVLDITSKPPATIEWE